MTAQGAQRGEPAHADKGHFERPGAMKRVELV